MGRLRRRQRLQGRAAARSQHEHRLFKGRYDHPQVNLSDEERTCTCGAPEYYSFPCVHQVAAVTDRGASIEYLICAVAPHYLADTWRAQYPAEVTLVLASRDEINRKELDKLMVWPWFKKAPKAAAAKKRKKSALEGRNKKRRAKRKCQKCALDYYPGHKCPELAQSSQAVVRGRGRGSSRGTRGVGGGRGGRALRGRVE